VQARIRLLDRPTSPAPVMSVGSEPLLVYEVRTTKPDEAVPLRGLLDLQIAGGERREIDGSPGRVVSRLQQTRSIQIPLSRLTDVSQPASYALVVNTQVAGHPIRSNRLVATFLPGRAATAVLRLNELEAARVDAVERRGCHAARPDPATAARIAEEKATLARFGTEAIWDPVYESFVVSSSQLTPNRAQVPAAEQRCERASECVPIELPLAPCDCATLLAVRADGAEALRSRVQREDANCPAAQQICVERTSTSVADCVDGWCVSFPRQAP